MNPAAELIEQVHRAGGELRIAGGKVKGLNIPAALLPELKANRDEIHRLLTAPAQSCATCQHRTAMKSCGEPVAAGLCEAGRFEIVWHPASGQNCPAWALKIKPREYL